MIMTNQVNMAEVTDEDMAVIPTSQQRVSCNGGGGALGHPLVWLTLGTDDKVVCPYCSRTYVKAAAENN
jgi:uncharacterized Zn-finger protein